MVQNSRALPDTMLQSIRFHTNDIHFAMDNLYADVLGCIFRMATRSFGRGSGRGYCITGRTVYGNVQVEYLCVVARTIP